MRTIMLAAAAITCGLGLGLAGEAAAGACPPGLPPGIVCGQPDYKLAPAGDYSIDAQHAGIVARVSHIGYSFSVFRFGDVDGRLTWNPAHPDQSTLSVKVKTASIATPVPNFATELAGANFLNAAAFPDATFTSTRFLQTAPTHGRVEGTFTLHGVSKPLTLDVDLIGAGPGFGSPRMGVHASGRIAPTAYGLGPMLGDTIDLQIDVEFVKGKG